MTDGDCRIIALWSNICTQCETQILWNCFTSQSTLFPIHWGSVAFQNSVLHTKSPFLCSFPMRRFGLMVQKLWGYLQSGARGCNGTYEGPALAQVPTATQWTLGTVGVGVGHSKWAPPPGNETIFADPLSDSVRLFGCWDGRRRSRTEIRPRRSPLTTHRRRHHAPVCRRRSSLKFPGSHYGQRLRRPCFAHHPKRRGGLHGGSTVLTVLTCTSAGPPSSSPATWTEVQVHSVYYGILSQILAFQVSQGRLEIVCAWSWPCSIFVCSWLSMRTSLEIDSIAPHMLHFWRGVCRHFAQSMTRCVFQSQLHWNKKSQVYKKWTIAQLLRTLVNLIEY
jgi:hypothetical protein